jgi:NAD(P)-dependent dehydrogenase (short-subunit alcohol dehydrogenase family)
MSQRLIGKVIVVTGASRGIGLGISQIFAAEGGTVAMLARGREALETVAARLPGAHAFVCDVADPASVGSTFTQIEERFGGIDILINNAGLASPHLIEEAGDDELQLQVSVNLLGPIYCMRSAIAAMRRRGGGDIVNVSSESVNTPYPFLTFYAATKTALETVTIGVRGELKGSNIRVSLYRSGRVESSFNDNWSPEIRTRVRDMAVASGFNDHSGGRIAADIPARAMLDLVTLDRSAHIDVMQLRGV